MCIAILYFSSLNRIETVTLLTIYNHEFGIKIITMVNDCAITMCDRQKSDCRLATVTTKICYDIMCCFENSAVIRCSGLLDKHIIS